MCWNGLAQLGLSSCLTVSVIRGDRFRGLVMHGIVSADGERRPI